MRLQEKILAQNTPQRDAEAYSDNDESEEEEDEGISDEKLMSVYEEHKETGRAGTTPWKTIISELKKITNERMTVHKLKQRVKQLGEPTPKATPKATTKSKQSAVIDIEDNDAVSKRYAARFDKLESQMTKVTEQWSLATAENTKFKKQNKSLQDENYKLSESLKKGIY